MASRRSGPLPAYRIADGRLPIFDPTGAARNGGRWNSPGRRVIYAATTYSGALLETLAHTNIGVIPKYQMYVELRIPAEVEIEEATAADIPGWDAPDQKASRQYGDRWLKERRTAVLLVPSVVTRMERNVVINPEHPACAKIQVSAPQPVIWDQRLFRR